MGAAKQKFYAVKVGRQPGIYRDWPTAEAQIRGFPQALHKRFSSRADAQAWVAQPAQQHTAAGPAGRAARAAGKKRHASSACSPADSGDNLADLPLAARLTPTPGVGSTSAGDAAAEPAGSEDARPVADGAALPVQAEPDVLYRMEFDGAAKGNPGPAGAGALIIRDDNNAQVGRICLPLGHMTNNQAEYFAVLAGLRAAQLLGIQRLKVVGDSLLVINQILGLWKVNHPLLQRLHKLVVAAKQDFRHLHLVHVLREHNQRADELCNHAVSGLGWQGLKDSKGIVWPQCAPNISLLEGQASSSTAFEQFSLKRRRGGSKTDDKPS